jgi:hypothetical protein
MLRSVDQFVQSFSQSGLIPAANLNAIRESPPRTSHAPEGDALARILVQPGKLTRYQTAAVPRGKA